MLFRKLNCLTPYEAMIIINIYCSSCTFNELGFFEHAPIFMPTIQALIEQNIIEKTNNPDIRHGFKLTGKGLSVLTKMLCAHPRVLKNYDPSKLETKIIN